MSVLIFTEALANTGLGHLGRCTALAEILIEQGNNEVKLIVDTDSSYPEWEFPCDVIKKNWKDRSSLEVLLQDWCQQPVVYVDSYLAHLEAYEVIKAQCSELICIDDDYRLDYPSGSTILNPGYPGLFIRYEDKYRVLTGKEHVLLRKPFREKFVIPKRCDPPEEILITLGGADPYSYAVTILKLLCEDAHNLKKHILIGNGFSNEKELYAIADKYTYFHKNLSAKQMRDLMLSVDFAITAGGQTTYELDRCGVPFLMIETAKNQKGTIRGFSEIEKVPAIIKPSEILNILQ